MDAASSVVITRKTELRHTEASYISSAGPDKPSQAALIPLRIIHLERARPDHVGPLQLFMAGRCAGFRWDATVCSRKPVNRRERGTRKRWKTRNRGTGQQQTGQDKGQDKGQTHYQDGKSTLRPNRLLFRPSQRWKTVGGSFIRADGQKKGIG